MPNVVVAGCGYWGANLVRNFAALGALAGVVDPRPQVAADFAAKYKVSARAWAETLADPSVSAVAIAAPAEQHARLVADALAAAWGFRRPNTTGDASRR